jgi:hypothetical protein
MDIISLFKNFNERKLAIENIHYNCVNNKDYLDQPISTRMKHLKNMIDNCSINRNNEIDKLLKEVPLFLNYKKNNTFDERKFTSDFIDNLCKKHGNLYIDINNFKNDYQHRDLDDIEKWFEIEYVKPLLEREFGNYKKYSCLDSKIINLEDKYENRPHNTKIYSILHVFHKFNDYPSHSDYQQCDQDRNKLI